MPFTKIEPKKENFSFSISNILNDRPKLSKLSEKSEELSSSSSSNKKMSEHDEADKSENFNEDDEIEQDYDEDTKDIDDDEDDELEVDINEDEMDSANEDYESKSVNSNEANSESSYLLNNESFVNFCRTYGLDLSSPGTDNNKYLYKMLLASQSQPLYNSWLSNWFTNMNNGSASGSDNNNSSSILNNKSNFTNSNESSIGENLMDIKTPSIFQKRVGHPYQNRNPPKRKKPRTSFNRPQIVELEKRFMKQKYLASNERSSLAKLLKMTDAQVKTWFQNRRTKWRRQNVEEKEAQRHAANKIIMSLKQQQQQQHQQTEVDDVSTFQAGPKDSLTFQNRLSSLQAAVAAAAANANCLTSLQQANILGSLVGKSGLGGESGIDLAQNPLAKLINMAADSELNKLKN